MKGKKKFRRIIAVMTVVMMAFIQATPVSFAAAGDGGSSAAASSAQQIVKSSANPIQAETLEDGDVQINKSISGTDTENIFDVTLDVTTAEKLDEIPTSADAAVVLVVDRSGSMEYDMDKDSGKSKARYKAAIGAAKTFVDDFSKDAVNAKRLVQVVQFSSNAERKSGWNWENVATDTGLENSKNDISSISTPSGGTNIEGGLQLAYNLINQANANRTLAGIKNVNVILLTDGCPTFHISSGKTSTDTISGESGGSSVAFYKDYHPVDGADGIAQKIKTTKINDSNISLYSIAFATGTNSKFYKDGAKWKESWSGSYVDGHLETSSNYTSVYNWLASFSSQAFKSSDTSGLKKNFENILKLIQLGAQAWNVTDPMAENIIYEGENSSAGNDETKANAYTFADGTLHWDLKNSPAQDTTTKNGKTYYHYQLTYPIVLDTTTDGFAFGTEKAANGSTILDYYMFSKSDEETLQSGMKHGSFDVPSIKGLCGGFSFTKVEKESKNPMQGVTFTLKGTSTGSNKSVGKTAVSNDKGLVSFSNIPAGTYTLTETTPDGYKDENISKTVVVSYGKVTIDGVEYTANSNIVIENEKLVTLEVTKNWIDAKDAVHGDIKVELQNQNGETVRTGVIKSGETLTWNDLPAYSGQTEIDYTEYKIVEKTALEGYRVSGGVIQNDGSGYKAALTNTKVTSISGEKIWNDGNDQDGLRPESITVRVKNGNEEVAVQTVTADDGWKYSFNNLPEYDKDGNKINYTVTEDPVSDYDAPVIAKNNQTITNSHTPEVTSRMVTKVWNDNNNQDGLRPQSITVQLKANDENYGNSVTLNESNGWSYTWENLPKNAAGQEISYTVTEVDDIDEYTPSYSANGAALTVTNTHIPGKTSRTVEKVWEDNNNQDGLRPSSISVQLYADGKAYGDAVTLNSGNNWSASWSELPEKAGGKTIEYTVSEPEVPEGYSTNTAYNNDGTITITNKHTPESISKTVTKVWNDNNNQDGKRPEKIQMQLYADGNLCEGKSVFIDSLSSWSYTWKNLPKYKDGQEIKYSVVETEVTDYSVAYSETENGFTVTNTYTPEKTSRTVTKVWDDNNNQDGKRPDSIKVQLKADGVNKGSEVTLNEANGWTYTWPELPKYRDGGIVISYTVDEVSTPAGYTKTVDSQETSILITNTHVPENVSKTISKNWDDDDDRDGKRPESIAVNLLANGSVAQSTILNESNNWTCTWNNLPKYKDGQKITYTAEEAVVSDYSLAEGSGIDQDGTITLKNTYTPNKISKTVRKVWNDADNQDGKRPRSIRVQLYANGEECGGLVELNKENNWSYTWNNLYEKENKQTIVYTVKEEATPEGYRVSYDQQKLEITNTHTPETTSVSGSKTWDDAGNQDGKRPASITVNLLANGVKKESKTVTAAANWEYSFTNLPKYENGTVIQYTVTEDAVTEYTTDVNGYDITNTHTPETTSVSGSKTWDDAGNQDGKRPASIKVNLLANGVKKESKTVTAAANWEYSFTNLPKYKNGQAIQYTVTEDAVAEYTTDVNGYNITNTHIPETTSVSGSKTWDDASNQDGKRPASIKVNLLANGVKKESKTVTAAANWEYSFTNLPKYENGTVIQYTVTEDAVAEYTTDVNGYNITNTHTPETTSVSGSKTWDDADNQDGKRPASIKVNLLANGVKTASKTVTAADKWEYSFTNLPKYENGTVIQYTVTEDAVAEYTTDVNGYDITNTHTPEVTSKTVSKAWDDADNQDGKRPASITVQLYADGNEVDGKTADLTSANNWSHTWNNLPVYAKGQKIVYTAKETAVPDGYTKDENGLTVTNTHETAKIDKTVTKVWDDKDNQDRIRPESVSVQLYADNQPKGNSVTLNAAGGWTYTWPNLPKYRDGGTEIVYTVVEDSVANYTTTYSNDTFTVTNHYTPAKTSKTVVKVWDDNNDQDGIRPKYIQVQLKADGKKLGGAATLNEANNWTYTWPNLDLKKDGQNINYTVEEIEKIAGYETSYSKDTFTITNKHTPETVSKTVTKTWNVGDSDKKPDVTVNLYADGTILRDKAVTLKDGNWAYTWTGLPKYKDHGKLIKYTVDEVNTDYITTINPVDGGYEIVNAKKPEKTVDVDGEGGANIGENVLTYTISYYNPHNTTATIKITDEIDSRLDVDEIKDGGKYTDADRTITWEFEVPAGGKGSVSFTAKVNRTAAAEDEIPNEAVVDYGNNVKTTTEPVKVPVKPTVDKTIKKVWAGEEDGYNKRPESIDVQLLRNGEVYKEATLNDENGWEKTWTKLPQFNSQNEQYEYTVKEISEVDDYITTYDQGSLTVTNTFNNKTSVKGEKTWSNDYYVQDETRPKAGIVVELYQNNDEKPFRTVTVMPDENDVWAYEFNDLPKYDAEGKLYEYKVVEIVPDGYSEEINGTDIHNRLNADYAGSLKIKKAVTLNGKPYDVTGIYYAGIFTDEACTELLTVNRDGQDESAIIALPVDGTESETITVDGLPLDYDKEHQSGGAPTTYYVAETDSEGNKIASGSEFTISIEGGTAVVSTKDVPEVTITNNYSGNAALTGTKTWHDDDDLAKIRPESIKVTLLQNGQVYHDPVTGDALVKTVTAEDNWTYSFVNLPEKDKLGRAYEYSVAESPVEGYSPEVDGMDIVNYVDQYYYDGVIEITKKTMLGDKAYKVNDVYYAGIFMDKDYTEPLLDENGEDVIWMLMLDNESEATFQINVPSGAIDETVTYYVTEVDEHGVPVDKAKGIQYTCQVNGGVCKIKNGSTSKVTFVNTYEVAKAPQTGDDSNLMIWMLMILMTLAAIAAVWVLRGRKAGSRS